MRFHITDTGLNTAERYRAALLEIDDTVPTETMNKITNILEAYQTQPPIARFIGLLEKLEIDEALLDELPASIEHKISPEELSAMKEFTDDDIIDKSEGKHPEVLNYLEDFSNRGWIEEVEEDEQQPYLSRIDHRLKEGNPLPLAISMTTEHLDKAELEELYDEIHSAPYLSGKQKYHMIWLVNNISQNKWKEFQGISHLIHCAFNLNKQ